jgi:hypothetical protein
MVVDRISRIASKDSLDSWADRLPPGEEEIRPMMGGWRVMQSGLKKAARPLYGLWSCKGR